MRVRLAGVGTQTAVLKGNIKMKNATVVLTAVLVGVGTVGVGAAYAQNARLQPVAPKATSRSCRWSRSALQRCAADVCRRRRQTSGGLFICSVEERPMASTLVSWR